MISLYGVTTNNVVTIPREKHLRSNTYARAARVANRQTLDGGSETIHAGFQAADSEIQISLSKISEADELKIKEMIEGDTHVYLSCRDGFFSGAIKSMRAKYGDVSLTYIIREQIQ